VNKKLIGIILTIVLVASFCFVIPVTADATPNTIVVGSDETYTTVQSAVAIAVSGDIIQVESGTYNESVLIDTPLTIIGVGDTKPVITGLATSYIVKIDTADVVILDNLEINGGGDSTGDNAFTSGVLVVNSNPVTIQNSLIRNVWANGADAITAQNSYVAVDANTIQSFHKRGVRFVESDGIVSNSTIIGDNVDGTSRVQNLVVLWSGSNVEVFGNNLHNALTETGVVPTWSSPAILVSAYNSVAPYNPSDADIHDNEISDCDTGVVVGSAYAGADGTDLSTADITDNTFSNLGVSINSEQSSVSFTVNGNVFNMTADTPVIDGLSTDKTGTGNMFNVNLPATVEEAVDSSFGGDTINIASGTYQVGQVVIDKNLTIVGDADEKPVFNPIASLAGTNSGNAWILIESDNEFNLSNVVIDGTDKWVYQAIRSHGNSTIENVDFLNIQGSLLGSPYRGVAIESFGGVIPSGAGSDTHNGAGLSDSLLTVNNCTFSQIGRIGILAKGTGATAIINDVNYTGKGDIDCLDYGVEAGAGATVEVTNSTIQNNIGVASVDGSTSAGILVTDYFGTGTQASINSNTLENNTTGIAVGYDETDESIVTAHYNIISGNGFGISSTAPEVDAIFNWWGDKTGATHSSNPTGVGDEVSDFVDFANWFTNEIGFTITVSPATYGVIAPSDDIEVAYGLNKTFTFTPNIRCYITDIFIDGVSIGVTQTYEFINVTSDHTVSAVFNINQTIGGGSGGGSPPENIGYINHSYDGAVSQEVTATSTDEETSLTIDSGTIAKDKNGNALNSVRIDPLVNVPPLPEGEDVVGIPYEFSPNGATFYPAITITFSYDPATVSDTAELKIVFWNGSEWVELTDIVVDETTGTVTGKTTHFTKFALITVPKPIVTTTTPIITPTVTPTETTPVVTATTIPTQTTTITPTVEPTVEPTQTTTSTVTTTTTPTQTISPTQTTTPTITVKPDGTNKATWFIVGLAVILVLALVIFLVKNRRKPTL